MARTAIDVFAPGINAKADVTYDTIDQANGMYIPKTVPTKDCLVLVKNTFAGAKKVTFKAGVNPPAMASGDLEQSMAQDAIMLFNLESARFMQADGTINVDFEAGMTGEITVLQKVRL